MRPYLAPLLLLPLLLSPLVSLSAQADNSYAPTIPTDCRVDTLSLTVDERVELEIEVLANSTTAATGAVRLAVSKGGRGQAPGQVLWTMTVRYEGSPVRVTGPRLPRGRYLVTMLFTPDDSQYDGCRAASKLRVGGPQDPGEDPQGGGTDELPDTGGPALSVLLLGLAMVTAGATTVSRSQRPTLSGR